MIHDSLEARPSSPASARSVPGIVWLLLIAAVIQVVVLWFSRSAITQPLPLESIVGIVSSATPFLLAAAVLIGLRRWPRGRRWLLGGAAAFALAGLFDLGRDLWFAAQPYGNVPVGDPSQALMRLRATVEAALAIIAPLLLGIGLLKSRAERTSPVRLVAMIVVGVAGVAAMVGGVLEVSISLGLTPEPSTPFDVPLLVLTAVSAAGFAVLAVAATSPVAGRQSMPEVLIAAGATLWIAARGWVQWSSFAFLSAGPQQAMPEGWYAMISLTNLAVLVGMLAMIAGFAVGGLLHRLSE